MVARCRPMHTLDPYPNCLRAGVLALYALVLYFLLKILSMVLSLKEPTVLWDVFNTDRNVKFVHFSLLLTLGHIAIKFFSVG